MSPHQQRVQKFRNQYSAGDEAPAGGICTTKSENARIDAWLKKRGNSVIGWRKRKKA